MKYLKIFSILIAALSLTACGDPNPYISTEGAGFWKGLWDGWTLLFAIIGEICGANVNVYEVHNNGIWYNLGFAAGTSTVLGIASR